MYLFENFLQIFISCNKGEGKDVQRLHFCAASLDSTIRLVQENPEKCRDHFSEILMGLSRAPHSTFLGSIRILSTWAPRETRQILEERRAREKPL